MIFGGELRVGQPSCEDFPPTDVPSYRLSTLHLSLMNMKPYSGIKRTPVVKKNPLHSNVISLKVFSVICQVLQFPGASPTVSAGPEELTGVL